jgi:periplasmic divalent cation tolerance protein
VGAAMGDEIIVLVTASGQEEAAVIGKALVDERLAACVNIVSGVRSLFTWKEKTQDEHETLLIAKSRLHLLEQLIQRVKSLHSYSVPEVIALPIIGGSADYLSWLRESTTKSNT